jgi:hypothetical protein
MKTNYLILLILLSLCSISNGQTVQRDSIKINYGKIFSNCLNGDIAPALQILEQYETKDLSAKDLKFKTSDKYKNYLQKYKTNIKSLARRGEKYRQM